MTFIFLFLTHFTLYNRFYVHPWNNWQRVKFPGNFLKQIFKLEKHWGRKVILRPDCTYLKRGYTGKGTESWDRNTCRCVLWGQSWGLRGEEEIHTSKAMAEGPTLIPGQVCRSEVRNVVAFELGSSTWWPTKARGRRAFNCPERKAETWSQWRGRRGNEVEDYKTTTQASRAKHGKWGRQRSQAWLSLWTYVTKFKKLLFGSFPSQLLSRVSLFFSFLKTAQCRTFYSHPPTDFLQHTEQAFGIASSHAGVSDKMSHQIPGMMLEFFIFFSCL